MSFLVLPIDSTPDAIVSFDIGEVVLTFRTYWNQRDQSWFVDILDAEETPLILSLRIGNKTILSKYLPDLAGTIFAISNDTLDQSDPGEFDLGKRVLIMYEEP